MHWRRDNARRVEEQLGANIRLVVKAWEYMFSAVALGKENANRHVD